MGVINLGSQIVVIQKDLAREVKATINTSYVLQMEGTNGATNWMLGYAKFLPICTGNVAFKVHAYIIEHTPVTVAQPQVIKDPDKASKLSPTKSFTSPFFAVILTVAACFSLIKLLIICLTGDSQDFDPPWNVRWSIMLGLDKQLLCRMSSKHIVRLCWTHHNSIKSDTLLFSNTLSFPPFPSSS